MKFIIFDFDETLVNTEQCQVYLRNSHGRESVAEILDSGKICTALYDEGVVPFFNELVESDDALVLVVTDSPESYCIKILDAHGFEIGADMVFGNAKKPCVNMASIIDRLDSLGLPLPERGSDCLVVGDSAKDVYFAHEINAFSIFVAWSVDSDILDWRTGWSSPTVVVKDLSSLKSNIDLFLSDYFEYKKPNFSRGFNTLTQNQVNNIYDYCDRDCANIEIGFHREFIPSFSACEIKEHRSTWFDVNYCIKPAKYLSHEELDNGEKFQFFSRKDKLVFGDSLKVKSRYYLSGFKSWAYENNFQGKIALVPVPASSPRECNNSFVMGQVCSWWTEWINEDKTLPYTAVNCDFVERIWPKPPSHSQFGPRTITPHLNTLGVWLSEEKQFDENVSAVVIIDDVTTSGCQIIAIAALFDALKCLPKNVPIFGFAWVKTTHLNPFIDFQAMLDSFNKSMTDDDI